MLPRPPNRLTPPSTTAATEFSSRLVLIVGSADPMRATSRIAAMPAQRPEIGVGGDADAVGADAERARAFLAAAGRQQMDAEAGVVEHDVRHDRHGATATRNG